MALIQCFVYIFVYTCSSDAQRCSVYTIKFLCKVLFHSLCRCISTVRIAILCQKSIINYTKTVVELHLQGLLFLFKRVSLDWSKHIDKNIESDFILHYFIIWPYYYNLRKTTKMLWETERKRKKLSWTMF